MKVLITGAAGFIGSNLTHYLVEQRPQWGLVALDLLTYAGNLENIAVLIDRKRIKFVKADIAERAAMDSLFKQEAFDLVFNLAAESHVDRSIHGAEAFVRTNVLGTQTLLDCARESRVKRFVHISTDEVYGSLGPTGAFKETTPLDPTSPYSASKAAADLMVLACGKTHGLDVIVTRCTNNYGPYQFPEKLIPLFVTNALEDKELPLYGDGMNVRSWLHVRDHCEALLRAAERGRKGEVYNVGGSASAESCNLEVTRSILRLLGKPETLVKKVTDRPAHDRRYAIDYSKAQGELGWEPRVEFAAGLEETVRWYREHEDWWRTVKSGAYLTFYEKNYGQRR
jgi:dTDP-glucose 4,6-dehydratase